MKIKSHSSAYYRKIIDVIKYHLNNFKNPNILEFGVRKGISTKFFLDLCNKNNGKLVSVDIVNYKNFVSNSIICLYLILFFIDQFLIINF